MPKKLFKKRRWRVRAKGKDGPSFSSKLISTDGIICLVLGIACFILLITTIVISTIHRGSRLTYWNTGSCRICNFADLFYNFS